MFSFPRFVLHQNKKTYLKQSEFPLEEMREDFFVWIKKIFQVCEFLIRLPFVCLMIVALSPIAVIKKIILKLFHAPCEIQKPNGSLKEQAQKIFKRWYSPHAKTLHRRIAGVRMRKHQKKNIPFRSWQIKHIGWVVIISAIFALPFTFSNLIGEFSLVRAQTTAHAVRGIEEFSNAKNGFKEFHLNDAEKSFQQAFSDFAEAEKSMTKIHSSLIALTHILPGKGGAPADGKALIDAGQDIAQAGAHFARAGDAFQPPFQLFDTNFLVSFEKMNQELKIATPFLSHADARLLSIREENIPIEHRQKFSHMRDLLHAISVNMKDITDLGDGIIRVLAKNQLRRYLVVFQNNTELRATGGFIGSYALVDIANGKIKHIEIPSGGSYDLQGSLRETVTSPEPLHMVNQLWQFQDANWFPDFPTSAKKLMWFYEKSGGPTVDGVIAINANVAEKLLTLTGPIVLQEYGKTITSENFLEETQKAVEIDFDRQKNTPKKFISDLVPKMISQLQKEAQSDMMPLVQILSDAIRTRDIQMYMRSSPDQELFQRFGATGELRATSGDYLMIVDTNVGAGKSDGVIEESVAHTLTIQNDGTLIVHLRIERSHHGDRANPFTGVSNINYIRVYVPYGCTVLSTSGFQEMDPSLFKDPPMEYHLDNDLKSIERDEKNDIAKKIATHTELGKTVITGWIATDVGESRVIELTYQLPFTVQDIRRDGYSLLLQRQSGSRIQVYTFDGAVASPWALEWVYPKDMNTTSFGFHWETKELHEDHVFGFTLLK